MYNDDIMHLERGLFHYPPNHFLRGYTRKPADHYYRPFYTHLYKELRSKWKVCYDGRLLALDFYSSWHRFIKYNADKCYFGFTFVTSITHDNGNYLELTDDFISDKLQKLEKSGALQNTMLVIMGDHGGRVHLATRNFDLHETLLDIVSRKMNGKREQKRGKSLFTAIPTDKSCVDNNVISNFCLCMVDGSADIGGLFLPIIGLIRKLSSLDIRMPNLFVQLGMRNKVNYTQKLNKREPAQVGDSYCFS
ncbi:hypothetical protein WR25_01543 [Diploscapter pachys]|uniref:Sulfatase N-terminal domain-containing protein n=1 Tax=Diploscapter pachys TaxID=2018661 RepID=A0A2A2K5L3_9BILA|nr:hypothetical protein WR25_01543 [Diploscapter pachys]